jgi:hypothetical protein
VSEKKLAPLRERTRTLSAVQRRKGSLMTAAKRREALQGDAAPRIIVPARCSESAQSFVVILRFNSHAQKFFAERVTVASDDNSGVPTDPGSYKIADCDLRLVRCPHCKSTLEVASCRFDEAPLTCTAISNSCPGWCDWLGLRGGNGA